VRLGLDVGGLFLRRIAASGEDPDGAEGDSGQG
jgi:hypothetical protein